MEAMREAWTDRRLDGLDLKVDRVEQKVSDLEMRVDERFDLVDQRFKKSTVVSAGSNERSTTASAASRIALLRISAPCSK
jgi:hypothetical protein